MTGVLVVTTAGLIGLLDAELADLRGGNGILLALFIPQPLLAVMFDCVFRGLDAAAGLHAAASWLLLSDAGCANGCMAILA